MRQVITAAAWLALAAPALAQTAPIPQDGFLIEEPGRMPLQLDGGGLPGVFEGLPTTGERITGPGGLRNGTGAVGISAPSLTGSNPVPIEPPAGDGLGIPLGGPVR